MLGKMRLTTTAAWLSALIAAILLVQAGCFGETPLATPSEAKADQQPGQDEPNLSKSPEDRTSEPSPCREKTLGVSVEGRPIRALFCNEGNGAPTLIMCAMHGDEKPSVLLCERLSQKWEDDTADLAGAPIILAPVVNPDGVAKKTRQNARGVDINRNFSFKWDKSKPGTRYYGGPEPESEPETRHLKNLVLESKPVRIITVHSPLHNINYDGPSAELAELMASHNGYKVVASIGYPTPGSFGNWAGNYLGLPVITLELPGGQPFEKIWRDNYPAILAAVHFRN